MIALTGNPPSRDVLTERDSVKMTKRHLAVLGRFRGLRQDTSTIAFVLNLDEPLVYRLLAEAREAMRRHG